MQKLFGDKDTIRGAPMFMTDGCNTQGPQLEKYFYLAFHGVDRSCGMSVSSRMLSVGTTWKKILRNS